MSDLPFVEQGVVSDQAKIVSRTIEHALQAERARMDHDGVSHRVAVAASIDAMIAEIAKHVVGNCTPADHPAVVVGIANSLSAHVLALASANTTHPSQ